jgi:hypothetical protein
MAVVLTHLKYDDNARKHFFYAGSGGNLAIVVKLMTLQT